MPTSGTGRTWTAVSAGFRLRAAGDRVWLDCEVHELWGDQMIELGEVISELRRELQDAISKGEGQPLRFELGTIELDAIVAVEKGGGGGAKVRFWVIELGGDAKVTQSSTQHIKLALQPRLVSGETPWVAGDEAADER
jgi:hypothetical protein